ncbi:hypothetical protein [Heyndrickxia sporothermodurans]|uniref:Uncharacterized protein n=1 Tax=Heyndrickxia sporothermodurans TaxID=46224 RepID=A0A150KLX8_9BACI|nr:hypothetical protein [Heyndrickxia sporothermodurans]KYC94342.1 hypothetical protein B4102_3693 [Heyndrickxia sporothermodurans]
MLESEGCGKMKQREQWRSARIRGMREDETTRAVLKFPNQRDAGR